jgi:hypothetical protein
VRVARVPKDEFEAAVESDRPPTVTALAARGKEAQAPRAPLGCDRKRQTMRFGLPIAI